MKNVLPLLLFLGIAVQTDAQQKMFYSFDIGFFQPLGKQQSQWQRGGGSFGMSLGIPLRFTRNQLWLMADARSLMQPCVKYPVTVPTETGPAFFEVDMNNLTTYLGGKLQYHLNTSTHFKPFMKAGAGMLYNRGDLGIMDPRETGEVCYPLILDYRQRTRTPFVSFGGGILLFSQDNLLSPQDESGDAGLVLSANYLHGFNPITVYPARTVKRGEPAVTPEGQPVVGQFRNPVTGQDHTHTLASSHRVQARMLEINLKIILSGDLVSKKKRKRN